MATLISVAVLITEAKIINLAMLAHNDRSTQAGRSGGQRSPSQATGERAPPDRPTSWHRLVAATSLKRTAKIAVCASPTNGMTNRSSAVEEIAGPCR